MNKPSMTEQEQPVEEPIVSYRVYRVIKQKDGSTEEETLKVDEVAESGLDALRAEMRERYGSYNMTCVWPPYGPQWRSTGTLEGFLGRQRG